MQKVSVTYQGGQSRYSDQAVDWMLAEIDGIELYAETKPSENDEVWTHSVLRAFIVGQAEEHGIDPNRLQFWLDD